MASGTAPLSYQWLENGTAISGATSASYTTAATVSGNDGSTFTVKVSNSVGSATSNSATLTVTPDPVAPSITTQPQNQSVIVGATATFTVVASGTAPLSYQWSKNGTAISGATSASYTTGATASGDGGSTFGVEVSNSAGSMTSSVATLTVTTATVAPTITAQPQNQSVTVGATATFTVVASGTAPFTYQWSKNGTAVSGATGASYTTPATVSGDNGATFTVTVSNAAGTQPSNPATLTVTVAATAPNITTQPQSQSVTTGMTATFSVVATGTAPLTYLWSKNSVVISGATASSYTTPATVNGDNGATFTVKVSNSAGSQTSGTATLTVTAAATAPNITTQPQSQSVTTGMTASFSVVATGTAPLSYQWSKNSVAISGATASSYTTPATVSGDNGATFTVTVSNSAGSQTSSTATLTVTAAPTAPNITTQPQSQSVTVGTTATFNVVATGSAPLSYQWSKNSAVISGATASSYTTPATVSGDNGATFTVTVSNSAGSQTSGVATLTVTAPITAPMITTQPQSLSVTVGATAIFSVVATGSAPLTYQWSKNGTAISGATASIYTTPATVSGDNGATFKVTVANSAGSQPSTAATLTVNALATVPTITTQPQSQSVTVGSTATFSVVATGTAPLTYQWSKNGTAISGATASSYTTPATVSGDNGATFTVTVSNSAGNQPSTAATLTVNAAGTAPTITTQPQSLSVTVGATATFSVVATGTAPLTYQWSENSVAISGATGSSYTTPATVSGDNGATFTVTVSNSAGSQPSNTATLTVNAAVAAPNITTQPQSQSVTVGSTATFSVVATGTAPLSYQWSKNSVAISGATASSYTTPATVSGDNGATFTVTVSNSAGSQPSNTATLLVNAAGIGTPILFQHIGSSANPVGVGISGSTFVLQIEPLPANTVAVMEVTVPNGTSVSISDTLAGTWSGAVCTADAGSGNYKASVFVQPLGASGGAESITIHASGQPVQAEYTFFQNINMSSPVGGHLCTAALNANSSGVISPGSFTPTTNDSNGGNVIWSATTLAAAANSNPNNWTAASGFTLLDGDIAWITNQGFPKAAQYEVQSNAAAVTPSISAAGENTNTDLFNSVSVALAVAGNGAAAPTAIHVQRIIHETVNVLNSPGTLKVMFPTSGNLRVIGMDWNDGCPQPGGAGCLSSITSSDGCPWTLRKDNPGAAVVAYAQNCAPCPTCTATLTLSGSQTVPGFSFRLYDIQNAASASFQNSVGNVGSCGTTLSNAPSITPTGAASGLTIAEMGDTDGVVTGLTSPTAGIFDLWTFNGENGVDMSENADFSGHLYYSTMAQQNWNFTKTDSPDTCYWEAGTFN